MNHKVLILYFLVAISVLGCKQQNTDEIVKGALGEKLEQHFTPYLEEAMSAYDIPGLAVAVIKDGQLVYAMAKGHRKADETELLQLSSIFHMASVSKLFVSTAIVQLQEQGKLDINDPVVKHLPYFSLDDERFDKITIQQMLSHVSGMPDTNEYEWDKPRYDENALEDYVKSLSSLQLNSDPGSEYSYSNIAYEVLGDVIAKVSGMSYEAYQEKYILKPAGMEASSHLKGKGVPINWAYPHMRFAYNKPWPVYPYNRRHAPSGTLHSNVLDMAKWAQLHLNRGNIDGNRILKETSYDVIWKERNNRYSEESSIGLSWFIDSFEGRKMYHHSGSDIGFTTNFILIPEEDLGLVILTNVTYAPIEVITGRALRTILDMEFRQREIPAFFSVTKAYKEQGMEAAVSLWNKLKEEEPDKYNFDPDSFTALFYAMFMDDEEGAYELSLLCKKLFPEEVHVIIKSEAESHYERVPVSKAAKAMLKVFK